MYFFLFKIKLKYGCRYPLIKAWRVQHTYTTSLLFPRSVLRFSPGISEKPTLPLSSSVSKATLLSVILVKWMLKVYPIYCHFWFLNNTLIGTGSIYRTSSLSEITLGPSTTMTWWRDLVKKVSNSAGYWPCAAPIGAEQLGSGVYISKFFQITLLQFRLILNSNPELSRNKAAAVDTHRRLNLDRKSAMAHYTENLNFADVRSTCMTRSNA